MKNLKKISIFSLTFIMGYVYMMSTVFTTTNQKQDQKNQQKSPPLIEASTHQLENGLKIIFLPSGIAPVITLGMLVHVGTADDPAEQVGLSHFIEHMMFKGTKKVPSHMFKKEILRNGGLTNALTEYDYTLYYTTLSSNKLEFILNIEADRLRHLSFSKKEVESEKKVVLEERNMRIENNPMGSVFERYLQAFNPYHPYGTIPIGFPHHIHAYTEASVRAHYETWYHPNNVTLFISGQFNQKEALSLIKKYFGKLKAKSLPVRQRPQNPDRDGVTQNIIQHNKRNSLVIFLKSFDAPNFSGLKDNKKKFYALTVLQQILGGNDLTDFTRHFVDQKKCALSINSQYDGVSIDPKSFSITSVLTPDMSMDVLKKELQTYLDDIIESGVSAEELSQAKNDLLMSLDSLKDGCCQYLQTIAQYIAKGFTIDDLNRYVAEIENISNEDIKETAQMIFQKPAAVAVEIYPENLKTPSKGA